MKKRELADHGVGIDFGTTNSVVAIHHPKSRKTAVCTDRATSLPHPSVVWYRLAEPPRVGREAKRQISSFADVPGNAFVQSVKRFLGHSESLDVFGARKLPRDVASDIFRYLIDDARDSHGFSIKEAIVTVPVYFDGLARRELRKAADAAGLYIKTFLHEPFAALIGYVCRHRAEDLSQMAGQNILVFDWGGGTLDITVGRVEENRIVELATEGLSNQAGDYFDELLGNVGKRRFVEANGIPAEQFEIRSTTKDRFRAECERCKIALSSEPEKRIELGDFYRTDGRVMDLSEVVTRGDFEAEINSVADEARRRVDKALEMAGLTARQIDLALLVGGSSRIPLVKELLRERFGHAVVEVPNADSIIAEGAAMADAFDVRPAFAASVAIELSDGVPHEVFKAGDLAIPDACRKNLNLFCTDNRDGVARLVVGLFDNASRRFERKRIITLPVNAELPKPYSHERVEASFVVDEDLVLTIDVKAATELQGAHDEIVDLRYAVSLSGM